MSLAIFTRQGMEEMAPGSMQGAGYGSFTIGFEVEDVDAQYERLKALGVTFVKLPATYPWGARSVLDSRSGWEYCQFLQQGNSLISPTLRPGTLDDLRSAYDVLTTALADLERRMGRPEGDNFWLDPAFIADYWQRSRPLFTHLARTAEQYWVAEEDGRIIGFARTTLHDGVRELTEFFVLPAFQGRGVGRDLLARSFPPEGARRRAIIATMDVPALARYLKCGVYPRFPIGYFFRQLQPAAISTDLEVRPATAGADTLTALRIIDRAILGFERDTRPPVPAARPPGLPLLPGRPACWLRILRQRSSPGRSPCWMRPIFRQSWPAPETEAAARNEEEFGMNLPLANRVALDYLLGRGYKLDAFMMLFLSDQPFGRFENYILSNPFFI